MGWDTGNNLEHKPFIFRRITKLGVHWKIEIKASHTFLSCSYRKQTPPEEISDCKHRNPRLVETRLMMLKTSPWCQPTQDLCITWSHTCSPLLPTAFKTPSLKAIRKFVSFEHGLHFFFVWCPVLNTVFFLHHTKKESWIS